MTDVIVRDHPAVRLARLVSMNTEPRIVAVLGSVPANDGFMFTCSLVSDHASFPCPIYTKAKTMDEAIEAALHLADTIKTPGYGDMKWGGQK